MSDRARTRRAIRAQRQASVRRWRWGAAWVAVVVSTGVAVAVLGSSDEPVPADSEPVDQQALGAQVFSASCATCHGPDLRGTFVGPALLDEIYAPDHHDDDAIRAAIANGVQPHHWDFAAMPAIPGLDVDQVDAVIAHIRAVQRDHGIGEPLEDPAQP